MHGVSRELSHYGDLSIPSLFAYSPLLSFHYLSSLQKSSQRVGPIETYGKFEGSHAVLSYMGQGGELAIVGTVAVCGLATTYSVAQDLFPLFFS